MGNKFGLIGRHLGHSWSPQIHAMLGDYDYQLFELEPKELGTFLNTTDRDGLNVTIPYKKDVMPYCAALSDTARRMGCVNTLVRTADGWYGDNTDYAGFRYIVERSGVDVRGRKTLVFGTGGASLAIKAALEDMGADPIISVSRSGENNYVNLSRHYDAEILVNATPLGMYPDVGTSPAPVANFPHCKGVFDAVYNPQRTALLLEAEQLGIPHANGLGMLVAQARKSAEQFVGHSIPNEIVEKIMSTLSRQMSNIVLIGMPGCGKSTVGRALATALGRPFIDADSEIEKEAGVSIPEIFADSGEPCFRAIETKVLARLGKGSGAVIATGGGCVTVQDNYPLLHQNGTVVWLRRALDRLPSEGRPLSQRSSMEDMYEKRKDKYAAFADITADNNGTVEQTLDEIMEALK